MIRFATLIAFALAASPLPAHADEGPLVLEIHSALAAPPSWKGKSLLVREKKGTFSMNMVGLEAMTHQAICK